MANMNAAIPVIHDRDPYKDSKSLEFGFRAKRFEEIRSIIQSILDEKGRAEILDLGGSEKYWQIGADFIRANRSRLRFTLVNPEVQESNDRTLFEFMVGDACDPKLFEGRRFDFVHSNSVIEHVGDEAQIARFAKNTRRLGDRYYMQTPDFWFPYEPHFRFPGFQWLPASVRALMMTKMRLGFFARQNSFREAKEHVDSIRLLTARQVKALFPDAQIRHERVLGLSKSIMAVKK
jgi:hypothetical protein